MARWNSDLTAYQWVDIGSTILSLIIYSVFISRIAISLYRTKKSVNAFLYITLMLIGLSIIFSQLQCVTLMFFPDDLFNATLFYLYSDFSKSLERVGICVDIVRLTLILVSQDKDYQRKKRNTFVIFIIALFILIIFQGFIASVLIDRAYFIKFLQDNYPQENAAKLLKRVF